MEHDEQLIKAHTDILTSLGDKLDRIEHRLFMDNGVESLQSKVNRINLWADNHEKSCSKCTSSCETSFTDVIKNWKTIATAIIAFAWILNTVVASIHNPKLTAQQAKQLAHEILILDPNLRQ